MISKDTQISLTYYVGGESLVTPGVYASTKGGLLQVVKPARYSRATQHTVLSSQFVEMALTKPTKPEGINFHRWSRSPEGQLALNWKKLGEEEKLSIHINMYVDSVGGELISFNLV